MRAIAPARYKVAQSVFEHSSRFGKRKKISHVPAGPAIAQAIGVVFRVEGLAPLSSRGDIPYIVDADLLIDAVLLGELQDLVELPRNIEPVFSARRNLQARRI